MAEQQAATTYSSPQAQYTVTYFDIPADRVLTVDTAKAALTMARKGTVESEKTLEKARFPGRELVIKRPDKGFSRLQMFQVNRRWYVLQVDGTSGAAKDKSYDQFFGSFSLTD